jgi:hypothetical protein
MEYYVVRIYRRDRGRGHKDGHSGPRLTGLVEDETGRKEAFHNAGELWRVLTRETSATAPKEPGTGV